MSAKSETSWSGRGRLCGPPHDSLIAHPARPRASSRASLPFPAHQPVCGTSPRARTNPLQPSLPVDFSASRRRGHSWSPLVRLRSAVTTAGAEHPLAARVVLPAESQASGSGLDGRSPDTHTRSVRTRGRRCLRSTSCPSPLASRRRSRLSAQLFPAVSLLPLPRFKNELRRAWLLPMVPRLSRRHRSLASVAPRSTAVSSTASMGHWRWQ